MSSRYSVVERKHDLFHPSWGARCICGTWLTKYDFDADEARQGAEWVLDQGPDYHFAHACPQDVWSMGRQEALF